MINATTRVATNVAVGLGSRESLRKIYWTFPLLLACAHHRSSLQNRADFLWREYDQHQASQLVPLLTQAIRFPTVAGNREAATNQKTWLANVARQLGLGFSDTGPVTEIELAGPAGAPVLGLVVHGDVQPVEAEGWTAPPFAGIERDGQIFGRGAADDKGPLVQALLAMAAFQRSGLARTHTVRLLVGSDEESGSADIKEYLGRHTPPDFSLVLDSEFPVVIGEKGWDGLTVSVPIDADGSSREREGAEAFPFTVASLDAGISPSIVPDRATLVLRWRRGTPDWRPLQEKLCAITPPEGIRTACSAEADRLMLRVFGRAAHSGMNIEGGRNALVHLARWIDAELPPGGASDILAFARLAGKDLYGTELGLTRIDPIWGRYAVNVAQIRRGSPFSDSEQGLTLVINLRRVPPMNGQQSREHLERVVADFNRSTGASLSPSGYFSDEPLAFDSQSKLVKRLLENYRRATGRSQRPVISGGGTYAKRLPRSIASGMWLPGKPYPGHDVDERVTVADLHLGTKILLFTLADLACSEPIKHPFER